MSDKEAGWYPDPSGENRQRFWDGDSWTEYYAPVLPVRAELHGADTAAQDYPYLVDAHAGAHHGVMVPPGTPGTGWPAAAVPGAPGTRRGRRDDTRVFTSGRRRQPLGLAAMVVGSILVVGLAGGVGWWLATGGEDPSDPGPTSSPGTPGAPGQGPVATGVVELPATVDGEVPPGGTWVGDLEVGGDTAVMLDARAGGPQDLVMTVWDGTGVAVTTNDDRGRALADLGGVSLDPLVMSPLPAGSYEVVVSERDGVAASFTLAATEITDELAFGAETVVQVQADTPWIGVVEIPADGTYTFEVVDTEGNDPTLLTRGPGGRILSQDDRSEDDPGRELDPLLEEFFEAGVHIVLIAEWDDKPTTVRVSVTEAG